MIVRDLIGFFPITPQPAYEMLSQVEAMKQSTEQALGEVPPTSGSKPELYFQVIVVGLFMGVNIVSPLVYRVPALSLAVDLDALMLLAFANAALAPVACWAVGSLIWCHWNGTGERGAWSWRAVSVLAVAVLFLVLYVNIGGPFNQLFLTHSHENGAVREFLLLMGGYGSEYLRFLE